jgi:hypothetical protein
MNSQGNTEKKEQHWSITISDFKPYYRAIAIKTAWYWHKHRYEDLWKRMEGPFMNPHSSTQLIFDKSPQNI